MNARRVLLFFAVLFCCHQVRAADSSPEQVFAQRLLPIFKSPNPSSCVQCHLAGVDLKNYILPSHEKTFLSLRDQGLIDLDQPEKSKILHLIQMGADDRRAAALIHAKTRQLELDAFTAWIKACCQDAKLRAAPRLDVKEQAKPAVPDAVIRHARKDRLLASFEQTVWALRFRCMSCHTEGTPENDKHRREHGDSVTWIKKAGPEATLEHLLSSKLLDLETPEKSLLLRKPLGEVKHGGGIKFLVGDQGYKAFRSWIEDVAAVRRGKFQRVADLPKKESGPLQFGSELWFKLTNTPADWGDLLLQVSVYRWDGRKEAWEEQPIATSDRKVWGKGRLWQHNLTLLAPVGSALAEEWKKGRPQLPPGRYLVKVHVDRDNRLGADWKAAFTEKDFAGQAEFEARWRSGYGAMTAVDADKVRRP